MKMMDAVPVLVLGVSITVMALAGDEALPVFAITSADVTKVSVVFTKDSPPVLEVTLNRAKASEFSSFTENHLSQTIAIRIDGEAVSKPQVRTKITGGVIVMNFDEADKAVQFARKLTETR